MLEIDYIGSVIGRCEFLY